LVALLGAWPGSSMAQFVDVLRGPLVNPGNGHVYYLISALNWPTAEAVAQDFGGHLATVRSQAEQNWLWSSFNVYEGNPRSFWIGLYDPDPFTTGGDLQQRRLEYFWSSGEPVVYSNWDTLQPDFGGTVPAQSGVTMWNDVGGRWDNDFTNVSHRAVVEIVPLDTPAVLHPLRDVGIAFGLVTQLTVVATGARPLFYQWQFNGADMPQSTNPALGIVGPVRVSHEGSYSVLVSNSFGQTRGGPFSLRVGTPVQLVPFGATWKFLDTGLEPAATWREPAFNDNGWPGGRAQFGYGEGDEATTIGYGPSTQNKYITTWFRTRFLVANASLLSGLTVRLLRDDGAIGYLNGVEIFRANITGRPVTAGTLALEQTTGAAETTHSIHAVDRAVLVNGTNVLAVEVHQGDPASSDVSFDLQLEAVERPPRLEILTVNADQLLLRWLAPLAPVILEKSPTLETSIPWKPVSGQINEFDGTMQIVMTREDTTEFFRLRRP
jgi:hypothetical protein